MLHDRFPEGVCIGAVVGIVATPVPFQQGELKNIVFQEPHAVLPLDVHEQLAIQDDFIT